MNIDELNSDCPDHDRSSCSDEQPINAGIDYRYGRLWCRRCHGLFEIKQKTKASEEVKMQKIREFEALKWRTSGLSPTLKEIWNLAESYHGIVENG